MKHEWQDIVFNWQKIKYTFTCGGNLFHYFFIIYLILVKPMKIEPFPYKDLSGKVS